MHETHTVLEKQNTYIQEVTLIFRHDTFELNNFSVKIVIVTIIII